MFRPDLFSDPAPKFHAAAKPAAAQVRAVLREHYPALGEPAPDLSQSGAMEINSNNFRVEAGDETFIVKRWPATPQHAAARTQAALADWLARQGQPLPMLRPAASGELVAEHQGFGWCVMEYVEGQYFSGAADQLRHAAAAVAALFRALDSAPASLHPQKRIEHPLQDWRRVLEEPERGRDAFAGVLDQAHAALLREEWPAVTAALADTLGMEPILRASTRLCHIDLHPHNILMAGGRVAALLDFPSLALAPATSLHAFNLFKLARQAMVARGAASPPPELLRQLEAAPEGLGPLAKAEILRRLMLILQLNMESGNREWNHVLPVMVRALREADALFVR
jgi:Ser/Thr protein kinase RdoA (MazF antagonist)